MSNYVVNEEKTYELINNSIKKVAPPKKLTVSEWAETYRVLSQESSPEPGKWSNERAPYQKFIMDAFSSPDTEQITGMTAAQTAKTEILLNIVGYIMTNDPGPILIVQPTISMGKNFSKRRLAPMLRDCPVLREKTRGYDESILEKGFAGGYLTIVGGNSPNELASKPIRILLLDEVDRYPATAGKEGDPVALAEKRTANFYNRKIVRLSTPGLKQTSKIYKLYLSSTQEVWNVPCPQCGEYQPLEFERLDFDTLEMSCIHCGCLSSEIEWKKAQSRGKFISSNPDASMFHRGFYLNSMASPWVKWREIVDKYLASKDDDYELMVWYNTYLGLPFEASVDENLDWEYLYKNRPIKYEAEIPDKVLFLTCGVDVQDDRLELEVVGFGPEKEKYGIIYKVLFGDPGASRVWELLDSFLKTKFKFKNGDELEIACTFIDTGGHHTEEVYDFVYEREFRNIFGIKGIGGSGKTVINSTKKTNRKKGRDITLISLGVNALKDMTYSSLRREKGEKGCCYYPNKIECGYGEKYFQSVTGEIKTTKVVRGVTTIEWQKIRPNEALDIRNYATAAMIFLNPNFENLKNMSREKLFKISHHIKTVKKRKQSTGIISKGVSI